MHLKKEINSKSDTWFIIDMKSILSTTNCSSLRCTQNEFNVISMGN